MSDEPRPQSEWARKRAAGKARRTERIKRQEAFFDLLVSGYSVEQIAKAMTMSASAVRRAIGQALDQRRLDAPEHFARLQIARLTKALRCADRSIEGGETAAIAPFLQVMTELNRFYGFAAAGPLRLQRSQAPAKISREPAPPLALAHAAPALEDVGSENFESRAKEALPR